DIAMEAEAVTDTAMPTDQGIPGVHGAGDKPGHGSVKIRDEATCESSKSGRCMFATTLVSELDAPTSRLGPDAGKLMANVQVAMLADQLYTLLRDAVFTHPTMSEGLGMLFARVPKQRDAAVKNAIT